MNTPRNNPAVNPDDPKWTAYILGELGEAERIEIEHLLETSEEARALVEELTLATESMKEELTSLLPLMMTPEQRAVIRKAAQPPKRWFEAFPSTWGLGLAAAAIVVLAVALPVALRISPALESADSATGASINRQSEQSPAKEVAVAANNSAPSAGAVPAATSTNQLAEKSVRGIERVARDELRQGGVIAETHTGSVAPVLTPVQVAELQQTGAAAVSAPQASTAFSNNPASGTPREAPENNVTDLIALTQLEKTENSTFAGVRADSASTVRDGISAQDQRNQQSQLAQQSQPPAAAPGAGGARGGGGGRGGGRGGAPATGAGAGGGVFGGVLGGVLTEAPRPAAAPPPPPPPSPPPSPVAPALRSVAAPIDRVNARTPNTEAYDRVTDNSFIRTTQENLATFSIDVDTASYANVRRFLNQNQLPPPDAVRIEELINYFNYDYAQPTGNAPIAPNMEVASAPWNPVNRLVRIGIKAREVNANRRPPSNLVFLIDVSGSMNSPEKLPLVKAGLNMLVERLGENDSVSIVVYAGNSGLVLAPTSGARKETLRQAIDSLQPGGSTNGASGIQLAYNQAIANFQRGGVNRVILMTDGDFNVGVTNQGDLTRLIEDRAKSGVFLSVLGFGMGNYKDSTLEKLADQGNGNYAYIDNLAEARKVLVEEMSGTLITVAKDVKIQVDFNPAQVEAYRLIGYENRVLRTEDFNNDAKDAGDMGAGHTVTALFEVVPKGGQIPGPSVDPSKYTQPQTAARAGGPAPNAGAASNEMLTLRVRYKLPEADSSTRMDVPLVDRGATFQRATTDFRFAASVAEFGMILRNSPYKGTARMDSVLDIAEGAVGPDRSGYRKEFVTLVQKARTLGR